MPKILVYITTLCVILASFVSNADGYTVVGNKIKDPNGATVILRGVDRPSLEWSTAGEGLSLADYTLMKNWGPKMNVVRLSLNSGSWLSSTAYQNTVDQQITWIRSLGLGVICDLHWNDNSGQKPMGDRTSITFWGQFAAKYKGNPWVMFELYNEPQQISWAQWRNGDTTYAGMQELYNAVRNTGGASNLVIAGGINWAFDLSGVPSNALTGSHIAYATHPYDYSGKQSGDWDAAFGNLAATYPVIATEFGQYCNSDSYVQTLLNYCESKGIHWLAWAWYVQDCNFPSIISDWNGTPSPVGVTVKGFLGTSSTTASATTTTTTTGSATSTTGSSTTAQTVYTDAVTAPWADWSWSTAYSLTDATHVHAGSQAIKFTGQSYQAIYFHTTSPFTFSSTAAIKFYVYGTTSVAASNFGVLIYAGSSNSQTGSTIVFPSAVGSGTWTLISITLSSFGAPAGTQVTGFAIQALVSGPLSTIWIDDVSISA